MKRRFYVHVMAGTPTESTHIHPYTKIEFIQNDLKVSRLTATRYLDELTEGGFVQKQKIGRTNYYINKPLYGILTGDAMQAGGT